MQPPSGKPVNSYVHFFLLSGLDTTPTDGVDDGEA